MRSYLLGKICRTCRSSVSRLVFAAFVSAPLTPLFSQDVTPPDSRAIYPVGLVTSVLAVTGTARDPLPGELLGSDVVRIALRRISNPRVCYENNSEIYDHWTPCPTGTYPNDRLWFSTGTISDPLGQPGYWSWDSSLVHWENMASYDLQAVAVDKVGNLRTYPGANSPDIVFDYTIPSADTEITIPATEKGYYDGKSVVSLAGEAYNVRIFRSIQVRLKRLTEPAAWWNEDSKTWVQTDTYTYVTATGGAWSWNVSGAEAFTMDGASYTFTSTGYNPANEAETPPTSRTIIVDNIPPQEQPADNVYLKTLALVSVPGPARSFDITVSTDPILAGSDINMTVTAKDGVNGYGNTVDFTGTINFHVDGVPGSPEVMDDDTVTDNIHGLPQQYTFVPGDHGSKTFQIRLRKAGQRCLRVEDSFNYGVNGTRIVHVNPTSPGYYKVTPSSDTIVSPFYPGIQELTVQFTDAFGNSVSSAGMPAYFAISEVHGSTGAIQYNWWLDIDTSTVMYTDSLGRIANVPSLAYRVSSQPGDWARVWVGTVPINQETYPAYAASGQNLSGRLITGNPRSAILTPCPGCVIDEKLVLSGVVSDEVLSRGQNWKAEFLVFRDTAPINYENYSINYGGWDKSGYFWNGSTWTPVSAGPIWLQAETDALGNWRYSGLTCDTKTEHKTGTCWARGERYDAWLRVTENDGNVESAGIESQRFYIAYKTESFSIISATHAYVGDSIVLRVAAVIEPGGEGDIAASYGGSVNFYLDGVRVGPAINIDNLSIDELGLPTSYYFHITDYGYKYFALRFSKPGENRTLMVQDAADPEITGSAAITVEVGYPSVRILAPTSAPYLASLTQLSGTAADNKGVAAVEVSLRRQPDGYYWGGGGWVETQSWLGAAVFSSSWTYSNIPALADGIQYTVVARARDTSGNWSVDYSTSMFQYDGGLPVSAVSAPAEGASIGSLPGISGTARDNGAGVGQIQIKISRASDNTSWDGTNSRWAAVETWALADGTSTWTCAGPPESALTSGATYFAVSRAVDAVGNLQASGGGSTFIYQMPPPSGAVAGITGELLGPTSIYWSWAPGSMSAADGYGIFTATGGFLAAVALNADGGASYIQTGLAPDNPVSIQAGGYNDGGFSPLAKSASYYTLAYAPAEVALSAVHISSVALAWALNGNPAGIAAMVQRADAGPAFSTNSVSYTYTGLSSCTSYYFRVWNVNTSAIPTEAVEVGPAFTGSYVPPPPASLSAQPLAGNRILLGWTPAPSDDISGYKLYFDNGGGILDYSVPLASLSAGQTLYTSGVLVSSAAYKFALRSVNGCGLEEKNTGIMARSASVRTLPRALAIIKVPQNGMRVSGNSVTVMAEMLTGTEAETREVKFQYKELASDLWLDIPARDPDRHPNPDAVAPYFIHWDVTGLAAGDYDLRAVATDLAAVSDLAPAAVRITAGAAGNDISENSTGGKVTKKQAISNLVSNILQTAAPGTGQMMRLEIPPGALQASTATVILTNAPLQVPPDPGDAEAAGEVVEIVLSNQSVLASGVKAVVSLTFPDVNNDGIMDGTTLHASRLEMYSAHSAAGPWQRDLQSVVDLPGKKVTGYTAHFSFFALFVPQAVNIDSARAYPLPWKPGSGGKFDSSPGTNGITFDNLTDRAEIRIYTVAGQLVRELKLTAADLGVKVWDGKNSDGRKAASGVYLAHIKSGSSVKVLKIAVER